MSFVVIVVVVVIRSHAGMFLRAVRKGSGRANNISGVVGSRRGRAMSEEGHFGLGGRCSARSKQEHKNTSARSSLCVNQTACEEWRQWRRRQTVVRVQRPRRVHPWAYRRYHTAEARLTAAVFHGARSHDPPAPCINCAAPPTARYRQPISTASPAFPAATATTSPPVDWK